MEILMSEKTGQKHTEKPEQLAFFEEPEYTRTENTRLCNKCNKWLSKEKFSTSSGAKYLRRECNSCNRELQKVRDRLREQHGMPGLNYSCPICLNNEKEVDGLGGNAGPGVLDHCHETKSFRGWLCHKCNRALGAFNDNKEYLKRAIEYLD